MAATDKPYRNQYRLDVVFGASCVLLLLTTVWMLYDDHNRPFKPIQRKFRDVEDALYTQQMAEKFPQDRLDKIKAVWEEADKAREKVKKAKEEVATKVGGDADAWLKKQALEKARLEAQYQDTKATYDSEVSLYNILVDQRDNATEPGHKKKLDEAAQAKKKLIAELDKKLQDLQRQLTENERVTSDTLAEQKKAEDELAAIEDNLRKLTNDFDRTAKLSAQKSWKVGDWFRALPIIDGFASPYKIQQVTLNDLTIEYGSFKDVPRYDRCTTCHLAIDRGGFTPAALRRLDLEEKKDDSEQVKKEKKSRREALQERYKEAVKFVKERGDDRKEDLGFKVGDLASKVPSVRLSEAQVRMYSAHPRLGLFVDSNSPHPVEKFGCTTCHAGQGSATEFYFAAHTPDNTAQKKEWEKEHKWEPFHDWEFPMLPARFVESGCVKCHHQMTDLIRYGSQEEAPKLLRGYNLVRENGCFGCHEISGLKSGKAVGPDLRLEPWPALEQLTADERAKILADPGNPPGTMRKVGPSLRRISEKTNEVWARKWINSPRGFRPDTRMPHFYNLSTNNADVLPQDQKDYPATEISSIAHYLFEESQAYLTGTDRFRRFNEDRLKYLKPLEERGQLSDKQAKELIEVRRRLEIAVKPTPLALQIVDGDGKPVPEGDIPASSDKADDLKAGRQLFTERGCLACHSHAGTEKAGADLAAVAGEAHFGPNLSRLAEKVVVHLKGQKDPVASRRWLIQWVLNPNVSHPRTRMPIMHLKPAEAARVADWLLSQKVDDREFQEWNDKDVPAPTQEMLKNLARVYLKKAPAVNTLKVDEVLEKGFTDLKTEAPLMTDDADEQVLVNIKPGDLNDKLKYYIGKKAVGRMGCFACHDIPGYEYAKPIGTPLNDWGKKDPARLAFEDIVAFVKANYQTVPARDDPTDKAKPAKKWTEAVKDGKKPYEQFFFDALEGHMREGFLHQKIEDPRSYDYNRDMKWDDRLRMPQFRFAHPRRTDGEGDDEFKARTDQAEAEAREAVMTFILGLVAEPIHPRYLNNPPPDRLAEVKGRQVLEKFNCAGCHLVRPGVYEVRADQQTRELLKLSHDTVAKGLSTDYGDVKAPIDFAADNAWGAPPPADPDRLQMFGVRPGIRKPTPRQVEQLGIDPDRDLLRFRLADAAAFVDPARQVKVFPAGVNVGVFKDQVVSESRSFGGTFADLMVPYLAKKDLTKYKMEGEGDDRDSNTARRDLPPPLVREGERVQPEWLFTFLRNPTPIRPQVILRMPKFNMSDDDAKALVNYFGGADKLRNPGIGLTYPYLTVPQRDEFYWRERSADYVGRLEKAGELEARGKSYLEETQKRLEAAREAATAAKDDAKKEAEAQRDALEAEVKALKEAVDTKNAARLKKSLEEAQLYWSDGYRLLATTGKSICLDCHRVGAVKAKEEQGPPLELAFSRLRPDWTEHWMANPDRLLTYPTPMPQNFPRGQLLFQELMSGSSLEQVGAARDVLMNLPKVADMPVNRSYRAATSGGK